MDARTRQGCFEYSIVLDVIVFVLRIGELIDIPWRVVFAIWATPPALYLLYRIFNFIYFR